MVTKSNLLERLVRVEQEFNVTKCTVNGFNRRVDDFKQIINEIKEHDKKQDEEINKLMMELEQLKTELRKKDDVIKNLIWDTIKNNEILERFAEDVLKERDCEAGTSD